MSRKGEFKTLLNAAAANGAGTDPFNVSDYDEVVLHIGAPSSTLTVKIRGTIEQTDLSTVNWAAAASVTNQVDGIAIVPLESAASIVKGDTGIVLSAATHAKLYRVNTALLHFLNAVVSGYSSGSVTVKAYGIRKARY